MKKTLFLIIFLFVFGFCFTEEAEAGTATFYPTGDSWIRSNSR